MAAGWMGLHTGGAAGLLQRARLISGAAALAADYERRAGEVSLAGQCGLSGLHNLEEFGLESYKGPAGNLHSDRVE